MSSVTKSLQLLSETDRIKRRNAFEGLLKTVREGTIEEKDELFLIAKTCLRGFEDKVERCREAAVHILLEIVPSLPVDILDWVLPSIVARIGIEPVVEDSEEIRLLLLKLALLCLNTFPHDVGPRNYLDFFRVLLENCLMDAFPDLKRLACDVCVRITEIEPKRVKPLTVPLAKKIKNMCLPHKHGVVRADGVRAFGALLLCGGVEVLGDMKDEQDNRTTVNALFVLTCDNSEQVRLALVTFLSQMLLEVTERAEQHRRLLPHVLLMLTDENETVRFAANSLLLKVGKLYMLDNEDNSINLEKRRVTMKDIEWYGDESYPDMTLSTVSTVHLPPMIQRPYLGARYVVAEVVRSILDKTLQDCVAMDWTIPFSKHNKRVVALRSLAMMIYFSETNIVQFAQQILATLYKSIKDDNEIVRTESLVCIELLGKFVTPDQYLPFIISQPDAATRQQEEAAANDVDVQRSKSKTITLTSANGQPVQPLPTLFSTSAATTKSSVLTAFRFILLGSKDTLTSTQATQIVRALTHNDLFDLDSPELCSALIDTLETLGNILASRGLIATPANPMPDNVRLDAKQRTLDSMMLYTLLCLKQGNATLSQKASKAIASLSNNVCGDATGIYTLHFGRILLRYHDSMPVSAFADLVQNATNLQFYTPELTSVFVSRLTDVNFSMRITIELQFFVILDQLLGGGSIRFTFSQIEDLLRFIIFPYVAFRPGGPAHLFRKVALSSLRHVLQNASFHSELALNSSLTEKVLNSWLSAVDTDDTEMRLACIQMLPLVVSLPLNSGFASDAWQHVLLRLDDQNENICMETIQRLASIFASGAAHPSFVDELQRKTDVVIKKLLVHMDDHIETIGIKSSVASLIARIAKLGDHFQAVVVESVREARARHHTTKYCDAIVAELSL